jgi:hypothetical protein
MNCDQFRQQIDAAPGARLSAESEAHRATCPACSNQLARVLRFEQLLAVAARIDVPPDCGARWTNPPARPIARRESGRRVMAWALAAGVVLVVGAVGLGRRREHVLDREVAEYVAAWPADAVAASPMASTDVDALLGAAGIARDPAGLPVRLGKPCVIARTGAVHLVLDTEAGPVAIVVMPEQRVDRPRTIEHAGVRGLVLPCPRGSVAVLAERGSAPPALAGAIRDALRYL